MKELTEMSKQLALLFIRDRDKWISDEIRLEFARCHFTLECNDRELSETCTLLGWSITHVRFAHNGTSQLEIMPPGNRVVAGKKVNTFRRSSEQTTYPVYFQ